MRSSSSRSTYAAGAQRTSAWTTGSRASAVITTFATGRRGLGQRSRRHPPAQRFLGGAQVRAAEQGGGVEQQHRPVTAPRRSVRHRVLPRPARASRRPYAVSRRGPRSAPARRGTNGRAPRRSGAAADGDGAQHVVLASGAAPIGGRSAAPAAAGRRTVLALAGRAAPDRPGIGRACDNAGKPAQVDSRGGELERGPVRRPLATPVPWSRRVRATAPPGRPGRGPDRGSPPVPATAGATVRTTSRAANSGLAQPCRANADRLDARREATDQRPGRRPDAKRSAEHVPGVWVRRPRLRMDIVAVVPQHTQADVGDRGAKAAARGADERAGPRRAAPRRKRR